MFAVHLVHGMHPELFEAKVTVGFLRFNCYVQLGGGEGGGEGRGGEGCRVKM